MNIFPAIDLLDGKAVRLYKGDYSKVTVYSENPREFVLDFYSQGAKYIHMVDLDGAKSGETPNFEIIKQLANIKDMFVEVGGGIRTLDTVKKYISSGVDRVILGTAALKDREFLLECIKLYGERIAVGVDIKDGFVAINGWCEKSDMPAIEFCQQLESIGVKTIICTDISKDGAMNGTNCDLYKTLSEKLKLDIIASGGVSTLEDVKRLKDLGLYGAIIGKAYYTGKISIKEAIEVAK